MIIWMCITVFCAIGLIHFVSQADIIMIIFTLVLTAGSAYMTYKAIKKPRKTVPTVYISEGGKAYHYKYNCPYMGKNPKNVSLWKAEKKGYKPCGHCSK